ncbi:MAG: PD-(D/E)XK nuclease family protein, partial [Bacteroidaceae bacterium]|nr:PD-(D/E)XK nuclease family protein [Bacteroidaceae bacterium]
PVKVSAGDIAVLARKGADVDKMAEALAQIGVPVNAVEHDIKDFGEIQLLMAILNYSLHRNNYSKAQILYLWENKKVEEIIFDRIKDIAWNGKNWHSESNFKNIKILEDIDEVLESSKGQSVQQLVETLLLRLDIWNHVAKWGNVSRRHANINTFVRAVKNYEEHTRLLDLACSVMGFINYFNTEDVNVETPFIKDPNAVSVLTYHKSKGLEWPVVILDGLDDNSLEENNLIKREFFGVQHYADNVQGITCASRNEYITICPKVVSGNSSVPEVLNKKIKLDNRYKDICERVKAEQARLLYVGFTRAKDFVITLSKGEDKQDDSKNKNANGEQKHDGPYSWLKGVGVYDESNIWKGTKEQVAKITIPLINGTLDIQKQYDKIDLTPENMPLDCDLERFINPSKLGTASVGNIADPEPQIITNPINLPLGNEQMNDVGTCIHDIYAVYDDTMKVGKVREIFGQHGFGNKFDANAQGILDAIKKLYEDLKGKYGDGKEIYHELPVLCQLDNGQIMRGEIDLLWMLNEKEAILVDYKSKKDDTENEAPEDTDAKLQAKAKGYYRQLCAYKTAIEKNGITVKAMVLFFPLQGKVLTFE